MIKVSLNAFLFSAFLSLNVSGFTLYQSIGYADENGKRISMESLGFSNMPIIYERSLWAKGKVKDTLDSSKMGEYFSEYEPQESLICLDVEHYKMKTVDTVDLGITRLVTIAKRFRQYHPDTKIGYYSTVPQRGYRQFLKGGERLERLKKTNLQLQALADEVDVIFPSLYTFSHNVDEWKIYAEGMIAEARRYDKPVIVFLWPQIHFSNRLSGGDFINGEFWKEQLRFVYENADGLVIWSQKRGSPKWDENWEWWLATNDFIDQIKVVNKKISSGGVGE